MTADVNRMFTGGDIKWICLKEYVGLRNDDTKLV